ncbi:MAG: hypothetical protein IM600_18535 [Bacteroidetes bacterium]|nr:hypothetical protein [Bacteroidota bacterium]
MSNNDKGSLIAIIILSTAMIVSAMLNSIEKNKLKSQIEILKTENARLNKLITKQNTDICLANQILELSETKKNVIFISCD